MKAESSSSKYTLSAYERDCITLAEDFLKINPIPREEIHLLISHLRTLYNLSVTVQLSTVDLSAKYTLPSSQFTFPGLNFTYISNLALGLDYHLNMVDLGLKPGTNLKT